MKNNIIILLLYIYISRWSMIVLVSVVLNRTVVNSGHGSIQVYAHQDDHAPPTYEMIPGFKPFTLYNF